MSSYLHREDFSLGPISYSEIEKGLYLGSLSAAKDIDTLNKLRITHILTLDTCPLPRNISELSHITTKYISLADLPKEDILIHFDDAHEFIEDGISKGAVLVHCYFGVSRSATIVIAYVMRKYNLSYSDALTRVKAKRSIVFPNQGFVTQLKLYKDMDHQIDPNNMKYKLFRLNVAADRVKRVKMLPQNFMNLIQSDPGLPQSQPDPNAFRCKKCRRVLATDRNLITHQNQGAPCNQIYFFEPLAWMNVAQNSQGKLLCPKCNHKVGSYTWVNGSHCPCGSVVAPAFYLVPSKVDHINVVKNVEMTF